MGVVVGSELPAAPRPHEDVIIQPEYRGAGIGKALLNAGADWADEQKHTRLQLLCDTANRSGLAFYASQKWQSTQLTCLMKMLPN